MTRVMRDSVNPYNVPENGTDLAAGYVNGRYAWTQAGWDRFPGEHRVTIDVFGTAPHSAEVLDIENFDATPAIAVEWVKARNALKPSYPPVLYVNRSNREQVISLQRSGGHALGKDYKLWVATLDGTDALPDMTGVVAIQVRDYGSYDQSIVFDDTWHEAPKPPVKPPVPPVKPPVTPPPLTLTEQEIQAFATVITPVVLNEVKVKLLAAFQEAMK